MLIWVFFSIAYFCKCLMPSFVFFLIIDSKAKDPEYKLLSVSISSTLSLIIDDAIITVVNRFIHNTGDDWLGIKGPMARIAHNFISMFLKIPLSDLDAIFFNF